MRTPAAERQRQHREKRRRLNLAQVQVWVPQDRVVEIKSISTRMTEEGSQDREKSQRHLDFAQFLVTRKVLKLLQTYSRALKNSLNGLTKTREKMRKQKK